MPAADERAFVRIGRITGAQGLRGEVKVAPCTAERANILAFRRVFAAAGEDGAKREFAVLSARLAGKSAVVLRLDACATRDEAEALRGNSLWLPVEDLPPPAQGEHYLHDLLGKRACLRENGRCFGRIEAMQDTAAGQSLLVVREGGRETLVPAVSAFIVRVDEESVVFDLPEGLPAPGADA